MPRSTITERTGQIAKVIGLHQRRNRTRYGQALIEGPQSVRELVKFAPGAIRDLYVTEAALAEHPDIDELARNADPYTHIVAPELFAELSDDAQGWLAVINTPPAPDLSELLAREPRLVVCAVETTDPGNLGTIIRTADAAGADAVILGRGSVELYNPKVVRSTAGSIFHLPILSSADVAEAAATARAAGLQILAADGSGEAVLMPGNTSAPDLTTPTMWLIGNEARGFAPEHLAVADVVVRIPLWGHAESLNAAVAAGLCVYASAIAQRA